MGQTARPATGTDDADGQPTSRTGDTTPPPIPTATPDQPTSAPRRGRRLVVALAVAVAVIAAAVAALLWPDGGTDDAATPATTTNPPATTATRAPTTQATESPATTAPVDTSTAVFPAAASGTRFGDPVAAARAFAVDFVGFTDPLFGEFMQGDARSGEVEVRPVATGPVTTVFVRQLGDDGSWWVLGSATGDIDVTVPGAGAAITSPVTVGGRALAFEGTVTVEVRQDGTRSALGTGIVTGGGDVLRPFSGEIGFSPPAEERGSVLFLTHSARDGRVWQAAAVRVRFA